MTALEPKEYKSAIPPTWCLGCGDYGVLNSLYKAFSELHIDYDNTVIVSGIGCSSRFPFFVKTYGVHTVHGRVLPVAMGVKLANPNLRVVATGGDGDGFSIGGGHVPHICRKNVDITYIIMDNRIYGLTKGQVAPTSDLGMVTSTTPYGSPDNPVNPLAFCLVYGATFVAQGYSGSPKEIAGLIKQGMEHKGFSYINLVSPCPTFNKTNTFQTFKDLVEPLPADHDRTNRAKAVELALNSEGKIRTGVFFEAKTPDYQERLDEIKKKAGKFTAAGFNGIVDMYRP
jgi:2-oxoglutarate ferredoxin oxidoreductase subunit beta